MKTYSKFNDPRMYRSELVMSLELPEAKVPVFAIKIGEEIHHTFVGFNSDSVEKIREFIDSVDVAIVEEVARSKFLTSLHIYEYLLLRGIEVKRHRLRKRVLKLMNLRLIQENEIRMDGVERGIKYYELDVKGYLIAREQGVYFTKGNRYLSFTKKAEIGATDTPQDVKRVLVGNQIVLGLLFRNSKMERFGIMETMCVDTHNEALDSCIIRTTAIVKIDKESVLAYEVVRDTPEAYAKLAEKVQRYYKLIRRTDYIDNNHQGDTSFPQLVICGESQEHNRRIVDYLRTHDLCRKEDPILYTEDLLNMHNSLNAIYEFLDDGSMRWYSLPRMSELEESSHERSTA